MCKSTALCLTRNSIACSSPTASFKLMAISTCSDGSMLKASLTCPLSVNPVIVTSTLKTQLVTAPVGLFSCLENKEYLQFCSGGCTVTVDSGLLPNAIRTAILAENFAVTLWVYYNQGALSAYQGFFNIKDGVNLFFEGGIQPSSSNVQINVLQGGFFSPAFPFSSFSNSWHFLAFSLEAQAVGYALDGAYTEVSTTQTASGLGSSDFILGSGDAAGSAYLGVMGGVSIYERKYAQQFRNNNFYL